MITVDTWQKYARIVVETDDLDPMYGFMRKAGKDMGPEWLAMFSLHFFLFYNAKGAAVCANACDKESFWNYVKEGYAGFDRGTERRHFRGIKGSFAVDKLSDKGYPQDIWDQMYGESYTRLTTRVERYFSGCQIGPYFTWKAMDILDRCLDKPVSLSLEEADRYMPDQPRKCAYATFPGKSLPYSLNAVVEAVSDLTAPGCETRKCGYSEAETILCTIHSFFVTKTYKIGDDVKKRHKQLAEFPELLKFLPSNQNWSVYEGTTISCA